MNTLLQPQQDFFLYVPVTQSKRVETRPTIDDMQSLEECLSASYDACIKVALAESLVVYACLWDEQDQPGGQN